MTDPLRKRGGGTNTKKKKKKSQDDKNPKAVTNRCFSEAGRKDGAELCGGRGS